MTSSAVTGEGIPSASARWGFWGTSAWGVGALAAFYAAQIAAVFLIAIWWTMAEYAAPRTVEEFQSHAIVASFTTLASLPATLLVIALAVKLARIRFADYLALKPVDTKAILFALACTLGYGTASLVLTYAAGRPMTAPWVQEIYRTARESGTLVLVLAVVAIAAPITEELLFRGFLLRGWAASRLGPAGAVVLTSLIWAAMHTQYDWFLVGEIFGLGLLFGYLRLRGGSTLTTVVMHGLYGLIAMGFTAAFG